MREKPCETCHIAHKCGPRWTITPEMCTDYGLWIAAQEAYAAGREETERRFRENSSSDAERDALRAEVERLVGLVKELTDAGECWYDHHGLCQAHNLQERPCPHSRAKEWLKKWALSVAAEATR